MTLLRRLVSRFGRRRARARIAFNLAPRASPYGGGNQFVRLLSDHLCDHGYEVVHRADDRLDAVVLVDGRPELTTFGIADVAALKRNRPSLVCIHRVNECDQRKGTAGMDDLLARTNAAADHTVFISAWLRDHHAGKWFDRSRPHSVILNGADARVFHPPSTTPPRAPFRVATHHWSDHAMKGFDVYAEVDRLIAEGALPGTELWVIGRWPAGIKMARRRGCFRLARAPASAELLRQCHAYVTASRWEPGGMHFIEGAQCGLPVAYHEDGGGIVELASRFGVGFRSDVGAALTRIQGEYGALRDRVAGRRPVGRPHVPRVPPPPRAAPGAASLRVTPEFFAAAPQMRDYLAETQVYLPYLMHFQRPNVRRPSFSTDAQGFRRTLRADGAAVTLENFNALPPEALPSALVGNSTAFGVGATSDARAIASELNRIGPGTWFNFAGRTLNPLQELLAFLLFCRVEVETAVIMSGINLLDMSYRFASPAQESVPPFYLERLSLARLGHDPEPRLRGWLGERWRRLRGRGREAADPFVESELLDQISRGLGDPQSLVQSSENPARALAHFRHVLDLWDSLRPRRVRALAFALQPVPEWFGRPYSEKERRLTEISESHRPDSWRRVRDVLRERSLAFKGEMLEACRTRGIAVVDLNAEPRLLALDWVFIDRYHLTDEAQEIVASALAAPRVQP